ncbi:MAG: HEAT repeat domain-containing protein [Planctomycetes bacterium]|nr:HEAT repeat domain-containing protein [Planctomycetota bacterium]
MASLRLWLLVLCCAGAAATRLAADDSRAAARKEYDTRRTAVARDDAAAWFSLSEWCAAKRLSLERLVCLQHTIDADPAHEKARLLLGFTHFDGKWLSPDELQAARGMIRYRGAWIRPADLAARRTADEQAERKRKKDLLEAMADPDKFKHNPAQHELVAILKPADLSRLQAALTSRSAEVRKNVVILFGKARLVESRDTLLGLLANDPEETVRHAAVLALGELGLPDTVPTVLRALESPDKFLRERAVQALDHLTFHRETEYRYDRAPSEQKGALAAWKSWWEEHREKPRADWAAEAHDSDIADLRRFAVEAMARSRDPRALPGLIAALEDEDREVRAAATDGLASFPTEEAIEAAAARLKDPNWEPRCAAIRALRATLGRPQEDEGPPVFAAIPAAGKTGPDPERLCSLMRGMLEDGQYEYVRTDAIWTLVWQKDPKAAETFAKYATDGWWPAANWSIRGLINLGDHELLEPIRAAEASPNPETRVSVLVAYRELGHGLLGEEVIPFCADAHESARAAAAHSLGLLKGEKGPIPEAAFPTLLGMLEDGNADVRHWSAWALRTLSGKNFDFDANAPESKRKTDAKRWREWWEKSGRK